jgi:predicted ribosome quality control (RQC) complex YloA/Tae2 family protein
MIRNYYTLLHLVEEINSHKGWFISEIFTQEKDSITLFINSEDRQNALHFVADGRNDSLYFRENFHRAKKNTVDLFQDAIEDTVKYAEVINKNRIIKLELINSDLYFIHFGGINSNLILTTKDRTILSAFNNEEEHVGTKIEIKENPLRSIEQFDKDMQLLKAISVSDQLLGKTYAKEFCERYNYNYDIKLNDIEISNLNYDLKSFTSELKHTKKYYLYEHNNNYLMSLTNISSGKLLNTFDDVSSAIHARVKKDVIDSNFEPEYKKIEKIIDRLSRKLENKIKAFDDNEESKQRIDQYRNYGDILMSHQKPNNKFGDIINVDDWSGNNIDIPLDKNMTLIENAQKYYEKAKKSEADLENRKKMLPKLISEKNELDTIIKEFETINNLKKLEKFKFNNRKILGLQMEYKNQSREDKFRKFDLGEDYVLYVGKNAANNDELTIKFAKPNDLWFHARGMSGSHVVLRINDPKKKPPKYILEKAAAIAAYYSGAKNAKYAPVAYTQKKYVRKPKGANPGSVTISKEDVIMVNPALPEEE